MAKQSRLAFVDLLRGLALLVMMEVHVFNSFIIPTFKEESWFIILNFVNGLVAPSFIFISGFAFVLASRKKLEDFRQYKYAFWRQIGRIGLIFLVGYAIHLPFYAKTRFLRESTPVQMNAFYGVDVLQCIAAGLLLLFITRLLIKKDKHYEIFTLASGIAWVLISVFMWQIDFRQYFHPFIAGYFNPMHGSLFPLFPWVGFILFGAYACQVYLRYKDKNEEEKFFKLAVRTGLVLIAAGYAVYWDLSPLYFEIPKPNPFFFILRLGYVLTLLSGAYYYSVKFKVERNFVTDTGKESLLVYWLHLQVLYRHFVNGTSLTSVVNKSFGIIECVSATILLMVLMILSAKFWSYLKGLHPKVATYATSTVVLGVLIYFFIK